jgi:hypothetical protein
LRGSRFEDPARKSENPKTQRKQRVIAEEGFVSLGLYPTIRAAQLAQRAFWAQAAKAKPGRPSRSGKPAQRRG